MTITAEKAIVELRRIAARIERWAIHDDVTAPGLPDAEILKETAALLEVLNGNARTEPC